MKFWKWYTSRKYLRRMTWSMVVLLFACLTAFSTAIYINAQNTILQIQHEANRKVQHQLHYSISSMNTFIKNFAMNVFLDHDITPFLHSRNLDIFELLQKLNKLDQYAASAPFLHSILIYNGATGTYHSTLRFNDESIRLYMNRLIREGNFPVGMQLKPMRLYSDSVQFFSFLIYDLTSTQQTSGSFVMVNVKPEWLTDNLKLINNQAEFKNSVSVVIDKEGQLIASTQLQADGKQTLSQSLIASILQQIRDGEPNGYLVHNEASSSEIVTYSQSVTSDWVVVTLQQRETVLYQLHQLRNHIIALTVLFLFVSIMVAFMLSRRLYKPIDALVTQMLPRDEQGSASRKIVKDELQYLSATYLEMTNKLNTMLKDRDANQLIVKNYVLRRLLTESDTISEIEWIQLVEKRSIILASSGSYVISVILIDNYKYFEDSFKDADQQLYRFAIQNISEETLSRIAACEMIDMRNGEFAVIIASPSTDMDLGNQVANAWRSVQATISTYYKLSLTASVSDSFHHYKDIAREYEQTRQLAQNRFTIGKGAVIQPRMLKNRSGDPFVFAERTKSIVRSMNAMDIPALRMDIVAYMTDARELPYDQAVHAVLRLLTLVSDTIQEMNANRLQPVSIDLQRYYRETLQKETLEETSEVLYEMFEQMAESRKLAKSDKSQILVDSIKEIIAQNYSDPNLNLQWIAEMLKLSANYIGKIFKASENVSMIDYINEVRLTQSLDLLENKTMSVGDVMEKVGYSNQSYYFRLFKQRFGTTPKEYRIKKNIT